jgi:transposase
MVEVLHDRVAGLDVHKQSVVACVRSPGPGRSRRAETREFETFIDDLERLRAWLVDEGVTHVAMEATGIYWKPVWFVLEEASFELLLVNARNMRMVPGRKTDVADAGWIAQLLECGLLRASLVPPPVIRELRDLTRYRKRLVQDRTREGQRVEKVLEDAGIKLASVASQTLSVSGRAMIDALIAGERDPEVLADLAKKKMRVKIPQLRRALVGRFGEHHAAMLRLHLDHIDHLDALINRLDAQIESKLGPFAEDLRRVRTITGVGPTTAQVLIAEIGVDMTAFPTAGHLASWCGVCPGNNESAGKQRSGRTNPASPWLTDALVQAAWAASRSRDTWLAARFWRLARRIGKKKAIIATAHAIVVAIWHIHTNQCDYTDLGIDWWDKRTSTANETARLKRRLEALGHRVTIEPAA